MIIDNLEQLGELICQTRKKQGLSQEELALATGMSKRLIIGLENGRRGVRVDNIIKICRLLGLSIDIK